MVDARVPTKGAIGMRLLPPQYARVRIDSAHGDQRTGPFLTRKDKFAIQVLVTVTKSVPRGFEKRRLKIPCYIGTDNDPGAKKAETWRNSWGAGEWDDLCNACGVGVEASAAKRTQKLIGKTIDVKIEIEKGTDGYRDKNRVTEFHQKGTVELGVLDDGASEDYVEDEEDPDDTEASTDDDTDDEDEDEDSDEEEEESEEDDEDDEEMDEDEDDLEEDEDEEDEEDEDEPPTPTRGRSRKSSKK